MGFGGDALTGFDSTVILLKSVKTVTVEMFRDMEIGMLVRSCFTPVLLGVNPAGKDVVFSPDPFEEWTFIIALTF